MRNPLGSSRKRETRCFFDRHEWNTQAKSAVLMVGV